MKTYERTVGSEVAKVFNTLAMIRKDEPRACDLLTVKDSLKSNSITSNFEVNNAVGNEVHDVTTVE